MDVREDAGMRYNDARKDYEERAKHEEIQCFDSRGGMDCGCDLCERWNASAGGAERSCTGCDAARIRDRELQDRKRRRAAARGRRLRYIRTTEYGEGQRGLAALALHGGNARL